MEGISGELVRQEGVRQISKISFYLHEHDFTLKILSKKVCNF